MTLPGRLFPAVLIAKRNLKRSRTRSALAGLGIVIGVLAIVSIGTLGVGLEHAVIESAGDLGGRIVVTPSEEYGDRLDARELKEIRRIARGSTVVPMRGRFGRVAFGGEVRPARIYAARQAGALYEADAGAIPEPLRSGALIGADLAAELDVEPGETVGVGSTDYRVRAVLERSSVPSGATPNEAVVVPGSESPVSGYDRAVVLAGDVRAANATAGRITGALNDRRERVGVTKLAERVEAITSLFDAVRAFLVGIGAISMLVAGISILNVTLLSVLRRRNEIGVLRAVGYRRRDVLAIFLAEATLLGVAGSVVGALAALTVVLGVDAVVAGGDLRVVHAETLWYLALGVGFGVGTSLLSSLYPAWKAATERPVEALRS
jgi:putative ABC transport system permease protein